MNTATQSEPPASRDGDAPSDASMDPIVCAMSAIPSDERGAHITLAQTLFADHQHVREIENGLEITLAADDLDNAATFIRNERRCCRHLDFTLHVPARESVLTLRVTGPGAAEELRALVALSR